MRGLLLCVWGDPFPGPAVRFGPRTRVFLAGSAEGWGVPTWGDDTIARSPAAQGPVEPLRKPAWEAVSSGSGPARTSPGAEGGQGGGQQAQTLLDGEVRRPLVPAFLTFYGRWAEAMSQGRPVGPWWHRSQ